MGGWSWIFWSLGAVVSLLGISLLLRGRWKDSGRGTLRCPKCWYPMSGVASDAGRRMCPECGGLTSGDAPLLRTRRRRSIRLLGLVVSTLGGALLLTPRIVDHGFFSVLPTTALLLLEPYFHEDRYVLPEDAPASAMTPPTSPIAAELARRDAASTLSPWQWRLYLENASLVRTRPRWPRGLPLAYAWRVPSWLSQSASPGQSPPPRYIQFSVTPVEAERRREQTTSAGIRTLNDLLTRSYLEPPDSTGRSRFRCEGKYFQFDESTQEHHLFTPATGHARVTLVDTPDQAIRADPDASIGNILKDECRALLFFRPETHRGRPAPRFILRTAAYSLPPHLAYGLSVEIRRDGQTIITGHLKNPRERVYFERAAHVELARWIAEDFRLDPSLARWDAVIRGDALASLRDLEKDAYWSGLFVVPVRFQP